MNVYVLDFVRDNDQMPQGCFWQSSTQWVGVPGDAYQNKRWIQSWLKKHQCTAILTDGANGFYVGDQKRGIRHLPPYPIENVVDTTGSGDVFRAGMLFGLELGWSLDLCLQYAAAAAALNCEGEGAIGGLTDRAKVEALVCAHPEIGELYKSSV
jgi:sugar/nucleoside kinase (ribokinase family)